MKLTLWPTSLGGRAVVVLLAAVIVVHLGSMLAYRESAIDAASDAHAAEVAGRLATALAAITERSPAERDATAHELSYDGLTLRWDRSPVAAAQTDKANAGLQGLVKGIEAASPGLRDDDLRLGYDNYQPSGDAHAILGSLRLSDGSWLSFTVPVITGIGLGLHGALLSTSVMAAGVILVAVLLVRTLIAPLRVLACAADAIGRGPGGRLRRSSPRVASVQRHAGEDRSPHHRPDAGARCRLA